MKNRTYGTCTYSNFFCKILPLNGEVSQAVYDKSSNVYHSNTCVNVSNYKTNALAQINAPQLFLTTQTQILMQWIKNWAKNININGAKWGR